MQLKTTFLAILSAACLQGGLFAQTYTDNFDTYHDYSSGDVTGTMWDGVHNGGNLDPNSDTTGGVLHWRNTGEGWEAPTHAGGPVLYKTVDGNFDAEVYMPFISNVQWSDGGIIARLPDASAGENYVTVKAFGTGNAAGVRWSINNVAGNANLGTPAKPYVRLQRRGTTFNFSTKANEGDPWVVGHTLDRPDMAGSLQVGLWHGTFSGNAVDRQFDNFKLTIVTGPLITTQPGAQKSLVGGSVTFTVAATGIEPLEYQWLHAGTNLPGATSASLTVDNVQLTDAGLYSVIVTDADGSTPSEDTQLEVFLNGQLYGDTFDVYHDYTLGDVTGTMWDGVLNVANLDATSDTTGGVLHWRNTGEGFENATATAPVLYKTVSGDFDAEVYMPSIQNIQWSDGGIIARLPDNSAGENWVTVKSFAPNSATGARWVVNSGPQGEQGFASAQPYLLLQRRGSTFKFSSKATAAGNWTLGHTLDRPDMLGNVQVGLWHGTYVANSAERQFDNFWLRTLVGPVITAQPQSQSVLAGASVSLSISATGIEPIEYIWKHNGVDVPGATTATLTIDPVTVSDAGEYKVVVTDADGSTESEVAILNVIPSLGVIADDFNAYHDFTGGNVTGTMWDGVLNAENLDPGSDTTGGVLHWRNTGEGWEGTIASGPFLYKMVAGDFDAQVEVAAVEYVTWSDGGIMARVSNVDDAGPGEDSVSGTLFSAFNTPDWAQANKIRSTDNDAVQNLWNSGVFGERFLRLERVGNKFNYYTKAIAEAAWSLRETVTRNDFPGVLQVGLQHGTFDPANGKAADRQFDNFRLSAPTIVGPISLSVVNGQLVLTWEGANLVLQQNSDLNNPTGWVDVPDVTGNSATLSIGTGNQFFRLRTP